MVMVYLFYNKNDKKIDFDVERNNNVTNPTDYSKEINELKEKYNNDDVVGILSFDNTDYSAPIMQGEDNEYYLNHTPDKEDNYMGSIYLDYRVDIDNSKKLLIFGHNSSRVDMPFKILENYYDKNYYDDHKYIYVTTNNVKKKYEVFSVFVEYSDFTYMNINFANDSDYLESFKSKGSLINEIYAAMKIINFSVNNLYKSIFNLLLLIYYRFTLIRCFSLTASANTFTWLSDISLSTLSTLSQMSLEIK